jgi:two-component system NtrC family sensor kinase
VPKPERWGWTLAAVAAMLAMGARAAMQPALGDALPFLFAYPAIVLVALRSGTGPALLAAAICAAWCVVPWFPPSLSTGQPAFQLGGFGVAALVTVLICAQSGPTATRSAETVGPLPDTSLIRWLRAVVWGAVLVPLIVFLAVGWWGYQRAFADAERSVVRANAVVTQHADRAFYAASEVLVRMREIVALPDEQVTAQAGELSQRLRDMAVGRPAVFALSVWDGRGGLLVSSQPTPPGPAVSVADRAYFRELSRTPTPLVVSEVIDGRLARRPLFNVVTRRTGPGGEFAGVVVVAIDPNYFQEFYRSLATEEPGISTFSLFKTDGALLTRWPASLDASRRVPDRSPILAQARSGQHNGILFMQSSFDPERRLLSFQRVRDLPVFTTAGLTEGAILANWYRFMGVLSAILLPIAAVLVYVAVLALRKTRGEQAVSIELQDEVRRRAQAERALLQSQKLEALGRVTGGVAHDFNNLLAVVSNNAHLLKRTSGSGAGEAQLAAISRAVAAGVRLTRQLLSFARKQALKPEVIALQEWLPGIAELLRTTLGRAIPLEIDVDPATRPVRVDTAELELALINLAVNAKDAMPDGGSLRIVAANDAASDAGTADAPPRVVLRVTDSGVGIAEAVLPKVFDPFFTTKPPGKGSGLGLSQVYGLCTQAGGSAAIESRPGQGTTVSMTFPAAPPDAGPVATIASLPDPKALAGRILLVEDNDELAQSQTALMASFGLEVVRARSADGALDLLARDGAAFGAVLSDISMPGSLDGIQLAFRIRETRPGLAVVLTTGYAARIHEATEAGFRVLGKPTEPADLFDELERALGTPRRAPSAQAVDS